ncbi:MAG: AhpC/TSA family protein [Bacteroidales bacterium]|nr:AhpC/TSA family protein [Bacteroidales bacterium]
MKKLILAIAMLLPLALTAQKSSLTVNVKNFGEGMSLTVLEPQGGRLQPTDTLTADRKGNFRLERRATEPSFFALTPTQAQGPAVHVLLLPGEKVNLSMDYRQQGNFMHITGVKGSKNMELYRQYNNLMAEVMDRPSLQASLPMQMERLVGENPTELMSAFLVTYFESAFDQYALLYKTVYDSLAGRYPHHEFVRHLGDKVKNVVAAGMEAPDIVLAGRDGREMKLSDLRGKVVLIDFWASWCRPCRAENPNVVRMYNQYKGRGFEIFSVSLDNNREAWLKAIETDGLVWPNHVSDLRGWSSAAGRLYGINSIPATVLVDRDGKVMARNLRGPQLEQTLKEIFGE